MQKRSLLVEDVQRIVPEPGMFASGEQRICDQAGAIRNTKKTTKWTTEPRALVENKERG